MRKLIGLAIPTLVAAATAFGGDCGSGGDCFTSNGTPFCNDASCCEAVCAVDSFCCTVAWDGICAGEANSLCVGCGQPGTGDCYSEGAPWCDQEGCCETVCGEDPFCCSAAWDGICVDEAFSFCTCAGSETQSCFSSHGAPYCSDFDCCVAVCADDPFCCSNSWDSICVGEAQSTCTGCGQPAAGSCFEEGGAGCNEEACCETVCADDPFCCSASWDGICVGEAESLCTTCGTFAAGDCFTSGGPACEDAECCEAVCAEDPFCCSAAWDSICVGEAVTLCGTCGAPAAGDCFTSGIPYCNDAACCEAVCGEDPYCCTSFWDGICVGEANSLCVGCGNPGTGDCFTTGGPFCDDGACCNAVCGQDPFCCSVAWDSICVGEAGSLCGAPCAGDINGNGIVDGADLGSLLGSWNTGGAGDLNGDGTTNGADLGVLLGNWGPC